ncbi:ubiquinone biosynthesis protein UbiH [Pragia fontium]|uniref:Ubiquinone biosynthesis protein UbiH n=1 Tax=Pragia fontium DSM 5563 = ATCC 49100 TaxID=1122977 RepID=A0AAJ4WC62_9GAMM|nr:ubiquinone biosynthesis protein UbiH [Pragia fontium]AKJ42650.1 ubiquinone biosynthesis protein UbiH [Pragia fontium]SFD14455.1 hypothetical protein SAMN02745723_108170 [Pragia fontium DSM 5563 = ATCC 49100]SUB82995.1 Uncharacterised protein [Pragia fontium]VEJ55895.1 Uncharacterised protein [Pragia fontium]
MTLFLQNCLSYPVIIFSGLLLIVLFYWVCAAFGLLDIDILNIDSPDMNIDSLDASALAGWLTKLGLAGIPLTVIITLVTLIGWLLSYFSVHLMLRWIETDFIRYLLGTAAFLLIAFIALLLTSMLLKPLRPILANHNKSKSVTGLIGKIAEVRSSIVTLQRGEALMEDGGGGLILQIRAPEDAGIVRGDRVVLIRYDAATHSYEVVSETEFNRL